MCFTQGEHSCSDKDGKVAVYAVLQTPYSSHRRLPDQELSQVLEVEGPDLSQHP